MLENKVQSFNLKLKTFAKALSFAFWLYTLHFTLYTFSFAQEQFIYDSKNKRDPFIPLVTPDGRLLKLDSEEGATGLLLEGIIYDKYGLSYAIVSGEVIKVGDKLGDYQVFKIEKNKVIFLKEGRSLEIELKREEP